MTYAWSNNVYTNELEDYFMLLTNKQYFIINLADLFPSLT